MNGWIEPEMKVIVENMEALEQLSLTIESSLYASGCHYGMGC